MLKTPSAMEPMMPSEVAITATLQDMAVDLLAKSEKLKASFSPIVQTSIGDMVRSMNCYYSNFIEGHNTHPIDIERALKKDFSQDHEKRNLQLEAKAHIELQQKIDLTDLANIDVTQSTYLLWLHQEFCSALPDEMLIVNNPETHEQRKVIPGQFRTGNVLIGQHIAIEPELITTFMNTFHERYTLSKLGRLQQVIAAAASHHRFLWIHPFYDGNGRVARLFSHAYLKKIGIGNHLWSISRGLARNHAEYKRLLMNADMPRQGNYDGRGALTQKGLSDFCAFFLRCCIDQIEFMEKLLEPHVLLQRIEKWSQEKVVSNQLPKGAFDLLKEALIQGEFERGQAANITHYQERQARTVLSALIKQGLLISDTPKGPVRLAFPNAIVEDWFPKLFLG